MLLWSHTRIVIALLGHVLRRFLLQRATFVCCLSDRWTVAWFVRIVLTCCPNNQVISEIWTQSPGMPVYVRFAQENGRARATYPFAWPIAITEIRFSTRIIGFFANLVEYMVRTSSERYRFRTGDPFDKIGSNADVHWFCCLWRERSPTLHTNQQRWIMCLSPKPFISQIHRN